MPYPSLHKTVRIILNIMSSGLEQAENDTSSAVVRVRIIENSGGYNCELVEQLPEAIQTECPICWQILKEPCLISCPYGQKICRECIEKIAKDNKPCPLCNKSKFTFMRDYGLERSLKELEVWCSYKKDGCEWKGKLGELKLHLNQNSSQAERVSVCGGRVHTQMWGVVPVSPHH